MSVTHYLNIGVQGGSGQAIADQITLNGNTEVNSSQSCPGSVNTQIPFVASLNTQGVSFVFDSDQNGTLHVNADGPYVFTCSAASATAGATYTNNAQTFTVLYTIAGGTKLVCSGTGAPTASGTLTKASGTGDATITFSAKVSSILDLTINKGVPYVWHNQSGLANPFSADVTGLWFSNGSATAANIRIRSLHN